MGLPWAEASLWVMNDDTSLGRTECKFRPQFKAQLWHVYNKFSLYIRPPHSHLHSKHLIIILFRHLLGRNTVATEYIFTMGLIGARFKNLLDF